MVDYLQTTIGKFIFKVAVDRYYTNEGIWVLQEGDQCRLGISDFLQQRSGDVAFIEVKPEGTKVSSGDEFVVIETIKVTGIVVCQSPIQKSKTNSRCNRVQLWLNHTPDTLRVTFQ